MKPILDGDNRSMPEGIKLNVIRMPKKELDELKKNSRFERFNQDSRGSFRVLKIGVLTPFLGRKNQYVEHRSEAVFRG